MVLEGGAFGRCLGHEGGALMNGISALIKETPESFFVPSTMRGHSKKTGLYDPGSKPSSDTKSVGILILDFQSSD